MKNNIILYDGDCNFCNFWIKFLIKYDKEDKFFLASLSSDLGKTLLKKIQIDSEKIDSIILINNNKVFVKSEAVLMICKNLGGWLRYLFLLKVVPIRIRDFIYDLIAKYRNRIFISHSCNNEVQEKIKSKTLNAIDL
ncbi:MAG: DUF393 domain-containing protein [Ignavibacterium sp.]|nr:DUF393 domain-containing protein [Ignavibacterium sp.]MDW8375852.1 DUF393 domain-containing protein [Ignavibacteriales bacterium]